MFIVTVCRLAPVLLEYDIIAISYVIWNPHWSQGQFPE